MKDKSKKIIYDIFGIIVISSILGLLFNMYNSNGISLVRQPTAYVPTDESKVFENNNLQDTNSPAVQPGITKKDSVFTGNVKSNDSIKKAAGIAKSETDQVNNGKTPPTNKNEENNLSYKTVSKDFVSKNLNDARIIIIDARSEEVYSKGHIGKAINIYPNQEDRNNFFNTIMALPTEKIYIIYCDGGMCDLSHSVYDAMKNFGFAKIYIFPGGWEEWGRK